MTLPRRRAAAVAGTAAIVAGYLFLCTAGTMTKFGVSASDHYARLAVAFVDGHTDLVEHPDGTATGDAAMFDRYWDLSLYQGRLYLYWGPVPALFGAALLRAFSVHVSDAHLVFWFALVRAVLGALVLVKAKDAFFPAQPWWPTWMGVVTLVLGAPLTLVFARATAYEAAIAGGQCFLVAGMSMAFVALDAPPGRATGRLLLFTASVCWTLGIGCRLGLAPACAALAAFTLVARSVRTPAPARRAAISGDACALGAPLAAGVVLQGAYDRIRFGSPWDTGLHRQVSSWAYHSALRFVLPNLYSYTSKPPRLAAGFPFVGAASWNGCWLWRLVPGLGLASSDVHFEPNVGFVWSTPLYAFSIIAWLALGRWLVGALARRSVTVVAPAPLLAWFTASSFAMATLGFAPCLVSFCSTARYLLDATAGLTFSATVGLSIVVSKWHRCTAARWTLAACTGAMVVASLVVNLALWVDGPYGESLKSKNPHLYEAVSSVFTRTAARPHG
jgi:hypothetical protein